MRKILLLLFLISLFLCCCSKKNKEITKIDDAKNAIIGVMTGTTGERYALQNFPGENIKSFDFIMDAISALKSGQVDAVITAQTTALNAVKHNQDIKFLPDRLSTEQSAIAIRKGRDSLLTSVNEIIAEFKNDGTLADMRKRWFKTDLTPYEQVQIAIPDTDDILVIGICASAEPFCFLDENQKINGHEFEFGSRIAAKLEKKPVFEDMKFSALLAALLSGKIDMIIADMTATEERKKSVDFTSAYFDNGQVMMVRNQQSQKKKFVLKTLDDIADKKVGVFTGTIFDKFVQEKYPEAKILRYDGSADILTALKTGKSDVVMMDLLTAKVVVKNDPDLGILSEEVLTKPLGFGFNKNNPQLRDRFNAFLQKIISDGTYEKIYKRWCENDPEKAVMPVYDLPENGEKMTIGVSVADLPYVAYQNGQYVGFDIELAKAFAQYENINLNIITMEFSALITALASGKVDLIADGIAITDERKKSIDFSDKYTDFKTAVLVRKENLADYSGIELSGKKDFLVNLKESFYNNIILENRYLLILDGLKTTMIISVLSAIFGTILGALVCFMRMSRSKMAKIIARIYISLLRGTPVLVILMMIFYIVFASVDINPVLVAVVAFGMNFAAYVSEMFRTGIESIDKGQTEAGIAMGFSRIKTFIYIVLPQSIKIILPVYKGEIISMVKMTSIVGYIAVQDLTKASDLIRSRTFDAFFPLFMVAILYFLISWLLLLSLGYLEKLTDPRSVRRGTK